MKRKQLIKLLYILYLLAIVAFIFNNSMASKGESAQSSGRLLALVNSILDSFGLPLFAGDTLIRKAAHFIEFFVLGASVFGYFVINTRIDMNKAIYSSFISCLIAMADETIQFFNGRGSMLLDVWLDFFSSLTAIILFYILCRFIQKK